MSRVMQGRASLLLLLPTLIVTSVSCGSSSSGGGGGGEGSTANTQPASSGAPSTTTDSGGGGGLDGDTSLPDSGLAADAAPHDGAANAATDGATDAGQGMYKPCPTDGGVCKVLPLGDSITWGYTAGNPNGDGGYRVELFADATSNQKHLTFVGSLSNGPTTTDAGIPFPKNNEGRSGWTIAQIQGIATTSQMVTVSGQSYAGALRDMPHIVLLHIGTNDMYSASQAAGSDTRLGALVDEILTALPDSLLAVSSIIPIPYATATVATYNAAVPGIVKQRAAQGKHVIYVEMFTGFPSGGLGSDNLHPNYNVGYPWMGDTWYATIKQYLP